MKARILFILCLVNFSVAAQRVTLDVNQDYIPVISLKGDTLKSSIPFGNHWVLDGVILDNENNQFLLNPKYGTYRVYVVSLYSGCSTYSEPFEVVANALPSIHEKEFILSVYPNPNDGLFNITIDSDKSETVIFELLTLDGKKLTDKKIKHQSGKEVVQFGKANLASGVYTVRINFGSIPFFRKLIVQ